jgi:site-specific DNA recombinase
MVRSAGIYVRISQDKEGKELGVRRQANDCQDLAARRRWKVVDTYNDNDVSAGGKLRRPEWQRLLGDLRTGRVNAVIAYSSSRMYRHLRDLAELIDLAESRDIQIATVASGNVDVTTADGRMQARILASVDQREWEATSERWKAQKRHAIEAGGYTGGQSEPFGYRRVDGTLEVDPNERSLLRDGVRRLGQGQTATRICREWNTEGRKTSRGARWRPQTLRRTLLSDHLTGGKGYPRVLSNEEAAIARAALASEDRQPGRPTGLKAPLAGYVFCAECKMKMTTGSGYYRCSTSHGGCGRTSIKGQALEYFVFSEIPRRWKPRMQWQQRPSGESKKLMVELRDLEAREKEITDELSDPKSRLTPKVAGAATRRIEARRKEITEILSRDLPSPEPPPITDPKQIVEAVFTGAIAFLREVLRKTVERIVVSRRQQRGREFDPERVEIVWR